MVTLFPDIQRRKWLVAWRVAGTLNPDPSTSQTTPQIAGQTRVHLIKLWPSWFPTSSYLAVDELSRAGAYRPARTRGARAHAPADVIHYPPNSRANAELSPEWQGKRWITPRMAGQTLNYPPNSRANAELPPKWQGKRARTWRSCAPSSSGGSWSAPSRREGGLFTRTVFQLWARGWASPPDKCRCIHI